MNTRSAVTVKTAVALLFAMQSSHLYADTYTRWLTDIGINDQVMSAANWGKGTTIGIVDNFSPNAGEAGNLFAAGQISPYSACGLSTAICNDGTTHGDGTASSAAQNKRSPNSTSYFKDGSIKWGPNSIWSPAPNANLILRSQLVGGVTNNAKFAISYGANIVNFSLLPEVVNPAAQVMSTKYLAEVANYAAQKNAYIVNAAGNNPAQAVFQQSLTANKTVGGFTTEGIHALLFVGMVDHNNFNSSVYSNKPGNTILTSKGTLFENPNYSQPYATAMVAQKYGNTSLYNIAMDAHKAYLNVIAANEAVQIVRNDTALLATANAAYAAAYAASVAANAKLNTARRALSVSINSEIQTTLSKIPQQIQTPNAADISLASRYLVVSDAHGGYDNTGAFKAYTSTAAPIVSGSMALLLSAWPILKKNGKAADLLLATATDLGAKGVDPIFGAGMLNMERAFQPYGSLSITNPKNGQKTQLSSYWDTAQTGLTQSQLDVNKKNSPFYWNTAAVNMTGAFTSLSNYTTFDEFGRNFSINMLFSFEGVGKSTLFSRLNPLPTNTNTGPVKLKLASGGELEYWQGFDEQETPAQLGFQPTTYAFRPSGYMGFTTTDGTHFAAGYGYSAQQAFASSLYNNSDFANLSSSMDVASLADIAKGGLITSYGMQIAPETRVALSWSSSANPLPGQEANAVDASNWSVGIAQQVNKEMSIGVTVSELNEKQGYLGNAYNSNSLLNLGDQNKSYTVGLSMGYAFNKNSSLLLEAGFSNTAAAEGSSLIETTAAQSRAYGASFMQKNIINDNDRLTLSVKQPLRVSSGKVGLIVASVNSEGDPIYSTEWSSLIPNGRQIDYKLAYETPLKNDQSLSLQAAYRQDALNIDGEKDASIGFNWSKRF